MVTKFLDKLSSICTIAAGGVLGIVTFTALANIIGRLFNSPVRGTYEIVTYGVMTSICLALGSTGFQKKHVSVDMIQVILPTKPRAVLESFQMLISAATFVIALYLLCFRMIPDTIASGRLTDIFRFPFFIVYIILAVGIFLATLMFFYHAVISFLPFFAKYRGEGTKDEA